MGSFTFDWNDFGRGLHVGPSDLNQPKNSWTGKNVTLADDDSAIVPIYAPVAVTLTGTGTSAGIINLTTTATTWSEPSYFNGYIAITALTASTGRAQLYIINTTTSVVTPYEIVATGATSAGSAPVFTYDTTFGALIYVAIGLGNVYSVKQSTGAVVASPMTGGALVNRLTIWGARMIAWNTSSETFYFSAASIYTSWTSLNYIAVGYTYDGISSIVPRNLDLVVIKPSGWYSVTGILGTSANVRQYSDSIGVISTDPIAQHNGNVYFTTATGVYKQAVNLLSFSGYQLSVAAFQRFGTDYFHSKISRTNMGYLAVSGFSAKTTVASSEYNVYLLNLLDRWQLISGVRTSGSSNIANTTFMVAGSSVSRMGHADDQYLWLLEFVSDGATENKVALQKILPNTFEPGKESGATTANTGTLVLSKIVTQTPAILKNIYVEAELMQLPTTGTISKYTGNATMALTVRNESIEAIAYNEATVGPTGTSSTFSTAFSLFSNTVEIATQTRVLKFNVNSAAYGYLNEIEINFKGFRIKRVWATGEAR